MEKTNVMRLLDKAEISYKPHFYDNSLTDGEKIAEILNMSSSGRELVRVAEIKALKKLKTVAKKKGYDNYLK